HHVAYCWPTSKGVCSPEDVQTSSGNGTNFDRNGRRCGAIIDGFGREAPFDGPADADSLDAASPAPVAPVAPVAPDSAGEAAAPGVGAAPEAGAAPGVGPGTGRAC